MCVHGHFYQPPRENPWLEAVEQQESAYPYHDWNERIAVECYEPNTAARVLDDEGRLDHLVDNYARISFDVGPTLLAWMEAVRPTLHEAIIDADVESSRRYGGHGSALAHAYSHPILPLANQRDRVTQVRWGVADFEHRFGRRPEGMWLPETAVDTDTLEVLAEEGIAFTLLAPSQARRVRPIGSRVWRETREGDLDTRVPYRVPLPSGRSIVVFFYDGAASRAVAFEGLLSSGERFAARLMRGLDGAGAPLAHIATDGESYGHHHRHGEMALAYALELIERHTSVELTNYGCFLERHPPRNEAEIAERTSWSCVHGVERWRGDCGCATGGPAGTSQAWRAPLRAALDWLCDELAGRYTDHARRLLKDPWMARDAYIDVVLDRSPANVERFLSTHARHPLDPADRTRALRLLEMQRHALLMFTSCGWFFDDLGRIETIQVLRYAARAIQLAQELSGDGRLERRFVDRLAHARSNDPDVGDGRQVYERHVAPSVVDLEQVAAHWAMSSLFESDGRRPRVHCYQLEVRRRQVEDAGRARLLLADFDVVSTITTERAALQAAVLHLGDHNLLCGLRRAGEAPPFGALETELRHAFATADIPATIRIMDAHLGAHGYSLKTLFKDEQRRILGTIMKATLQEVEEAYRAIHRPQAPLMLFLHDLGLAPPTPLRQAAEVVLNADLRDALAVRLPDGQRLRSLLERARRWDLHVDAVGLGHALQQAIVRVTRRVARQLSDGERLPAFGDDQEILVQGLSGLVALTRSEPLDVDLSRPQNLLWRVVQARGPQLREQAARGESDAESWLRSLRRLGDLLRVRVD